MNYIEKVRAEIRKNFNENNFSKADIELSLSPSKSYRLQATNYCSKDTHWALTKVEIYHQSTNEKLFDFLVNHSQFFYAWLIKANNEFLICAEDVFGGQTVIDLHDRKIASYSPNEDGFIWTEFHLSPDGNTLATIGCYWACAYVIKIFDFSNPLDLPLKETKEIELIGNDEVIVKWLDNETFCTKGFERVYERSVNGDINGKVLSSKPVERQLNIYST